MKRWGWMYEEGGREGGGGYGNGEHELQFIFPLGFVGNQRMSCGFSKFNIDINFFTPIQYYSHARDGGTVPIVWNL